MFTILVDFAASLSSLGLRFTFSSNRLDFDPVSKFNCD